MSSCLHSRYSQGNNHSGRTLPHHSHKCAGSRESPGYTCYELTRSAAGKKISTNYSRKLNTDSGRELLSQKVPTTNPFVTAVRLQPAFLFHHMVSHTSLASPFVHTALSFLFLAGIWGCLVIFPTHSTATALIPDYIPELTFNRS